MPDNFQAVLSIVIALIPGALYVWSFERQAGRYGIGASDRVLRFVGGSAIFFAVFAWPLYWLYATYRESFETADINISQWLALVPILYVLVPITAGTLIGKGVREQARWAKALVGPDPAPRAWDYLFQYGVDGWIRCRLKSGTWIAGAFAEYGGRQSYAAGYPEPQDIYLARSVQVDPETGEFQFEGDEPLMGEGGLLLRWEEIEYLEFLDAETDTETSEQYEEEE